MGQYLRNMYKIKELRKKILFTLAMIVIIRFGSQMPVPGIDVSYYKEWIAQNSNGAFNIFSAFTGGSFENFSLFALGITPYITATIIIQLLSIVIPRLEELMKDGDYGQKKMEWIYRWTALGLAFAESIAMAVGFSRSGLLPNMTVLRGISVVFFLTLGVVITIVISELIKKKGIGNGTSIILMVNILSGMPGDIATLFESFVFSKTVAKGVLSAVIIITIIVAAAFFVVILDEGIHKVPVQYSKQISGRKVIGGRQSFIPIKVNIASVVPVIFASSLYSMPQLVASLTGKGYGSGLSRIILYMVNQNNWFDPSKPIYTLGVIPYIILIYFFGYFYAAISFNPTEVADNIKKQGGVIPGIRAGKPTEEYLAKISGNLVIIGTTGLLIATLIPTICSNLSGADLSFGGTSIIIVVGVIIETIEQIDSQMQARNYKAFL